tara:strand:- start:295 stop:540 length:246 start_codon:yes stop_codon:yes gene_type:complete
MSYYKNEHVLEEFYKNLLNMEDPSRIHIPRSDVFYVREAIRQRTGEEYTLDHVERAMYLEGHLLAEDVFEPNRPRPGIDSE